MPVLTANIKALFVFNSGFRRCRLRCHPWPIRFRQDDLFERANGSFEIGASFRHSVAFLLP
jgi:hypothetical protein